MASPLKSAFGAAWAEDIASSVFETNEALEKGLDTHDWKSFPIKPLELYFGELGTDSPATAAVELGRSGGVKGVSFRVELNERLTVFSREGRFTSRLKEKLRSHDNEDFRKAFLVRANHVATRCLRILTDVRSKKNLQDRVKNGNRKALFSLELMLKVAPDAAPLAFRDMSVENVQFWNDWLDNWYMVNGRVEDLTSNPQAFIRESGVR